jgi:hypothetical protein
VLQAVLDAADARLGEDDKLPGSFVTTVDGTTASAMLGVAAEQFGSYATDASVATAAIGTFPHAVAIIKCKDAAAAGEVKKLVAGGFDPEKWICVFPEQCFVVESGEYILLAATKNVSADALIAGFTELSGGSVGSVNVFYAR